MSRSVVLKFKCITKVEAWVRSFKDERVFVKRITAEYTDSAGDPYRKSFETKIGDPTVPDSGTHESLAALKYQW